MRIVRWGLVIAAVALALLAVAGIIFYATFDPDDHRDDIVRLLEEKTGRTLRIEAPLSLAFFPGIGIELGKVTLENPPGFGAESFATIDELALRVEVLPLLGGHLVVDGLEIDGFVLALRKRADGVDNWSDLAEKAPRGSGRADTAVSAPGETWLKDFAVQRVRLTNGAVTWQDDDSGRRYSISDLRLETGSIAPGSDAPVEGGLRVESSRGGVAAEVGLSGTIGLSRDLAKVTLPDLHVRLAFQGPGLPPGGLAGQIAARVSYDAANAEITLEEMAVKGPGGVELAGRLRTAVSGPLAVDGIVTLRPFSPRAVMAAAQIEVPATSDPDVLQSAEGRVVLKGSADRLVLAPVTLRFDETRIGGRAEIALAAFPTVDFELEIDRLDLDRYLPPGAAASGERKLQPEGEGEQEQASPGLLAGLAGVTTRGTVSIGTLKVGGATMSATRIGISTGSGAVDLDPVKAGFYGGSYRGSVALRAAGTGVHWHVIESAEGVKLGPLLRDIAGEERIEGTGRIEAELKGQGVAYATFRRNVQGRVAFDFRDGALKGVNIPQVMCDIKAMLKGRKPENTAPLQTDFSSLTGSLSVGSGRVSSDDLVLKSPFLRVTGKGGANLVDERLDYLLTAKVVDSSRGQGGKDFTDLEGIPVGVRVAGTLREPSFEPDFESALAVLAKRQLEQESDDLVEKARGEIEKALRRLF